MSSHNLNIFIMILYKYYKELPYWVNVVIRIIEFLKQYSTIFNGTFIVINISSFTIE